MEPELASTIFPSTLRLILTGRLSLAPSTRAYESADRSDFLSSWRNNQFFFPLQLRSCPMSESMTSPSFLSKTLTSFLSTTLLPSLLFFQHFFQELSIHCIIWIQYSTLWRLGFFCLLINWITQLALPRKMIGLDSIVYDSLVYASGSFIIFIVPSIRPSIQF